MATIHSAISGETYVFEPAELMINDELTDN